MKTLNTVLFSIMMMLFSSMSFAGASCYITGPASAEVGDEVTYYYHNNGGAYNMVWDIDPIYATVVSTNGSNNSIRIKIKKEGAIEVKATGSGGSFNCQASVIVTAYCYIPDVDTEYTTTCAGGRLRFYVKYPKAGYIYSWRYNHSGDKYYSFGSGTSANILANYDGYMLHVTKGTCTKMNFINGLYCNDGNMGIEGEKTESVFPNPSSDATYLSFSASSENKYGIKVVDLTGKLVQIIAEDANYSDGLNTIKIADSNLSRGFYIVSVFENGRMMKSHKFIRE